MVCNNIMVWVICPRCARVWTPLVPEGSFCLLSIPLGELDFVGYLRGGHTD